MEGFAGPGIYIATFVSNIRISHGSVSLSPGSVIRKNEEERKYILDGRVNSPLSSLFQL